MDDLNLNGKDNFTSSFQDAEAFTDRMIRLTKNGMQSNQLSSQGLPELLVNMIRILNVDVEDRMDAISCPTGKLIVILFAKNTDAGKQSVYTRENLIHEGRPVDIVILPNNELLDELKNANILTSLDYIYAFILNTKKASAEYISPVEIYKHIFARYFFKVKYFASTFELDDITIEDLKQDIYNGTGGMLTYNDLMMEIEEGASAIKLFDQNDCIKYFTTDSYFDIIDELSGEFFEDEAEDYDEDVEEDVDFGEEAKEEIKEEVEEAEDTDIKNCFDDIPETTEE